MKLSFSTFLVSAAFPVVAGVGSSKGAFGWASLEVHLPKTLSDLTAATSADGIIYIAGGCGKPSSRILLRFQNAAAVLTSTFHVFPLRRC